MSHNQDEHAEFVNSVAEFASHVMTLWSAQKELNVILQKQIGEHLQILNVYQDLLRELRDQNIGYRALLVEHETRLTGIEKSLREETYYRGFDIVNN